ncbi:Lrp/AsnC family transcriptional regulator [Microtetraspora fusca]|uniref:Lrp/AsnC family transcriptional regulator n=1 Tax=Microtetraspora fusca TaxID=1997 RepID=A0ABW6VJT7_MICFU|nr:Lrp/AsnC family transcriptional regulator [Microtetraspora fusca]
MNALSQLDLTLVRALRRHPRAPLKDLAAACGVSERTAGRHLDALLDRGTIRVTATLISERIGEGLVAALDVTCAPGRAAQVADELAARDDVRFAAQTVGSADVVAELTAADRATLVRSLSDDIPRIPGILSMRTAIVLETLLTANDWDPGGPDTPWRARARRGEQPPRAPALDTTDRRIEQALRRDARLPVARLAQELGMSESGVRRRLEHLLACEALVLRCEVPADLLGYPVETRFLLNVQPRHLERALRQLAAEPVIRTLEVVTGPFNVLGYAAHRTPGEITMLFHRSLAPLAGVLATDVSVVLRATKRSWTRLGGDT